MDAYQNRSIYRQRIQTKDLVFYGVSHRETDLFVGTKTDRSAVILPAVKRFRSALDEQIENNPEFHTSLTPVLYNGIEQTMIRHMCRAAELAGVGPMAAVAGAFCQTVQDALGAEEKELIVENGGDILICSERPRTIALFAGDSPLSMKMALKLDPSDLPLGICASAGTFGHSLSFGRADMAMCISRDVLLADACATRLGNAIKTPGDLKSAVESVLDVPGIIGAVGIIGDRFAAAGRVTLAPIDNRL